MDVERKPGLSDVEVRPEDFPEIPEEIEAKEGVKATKSSFDAKIEDQDGKPMVESPATKDVTITIPTEIEKIETLSKGSTDDSVTWWATYYLRKVKQALKNGWRIITGKPAE